MIDTTRSADLTVRDVVNGLESMEKWTHQLRKALATLDQEQRLDIKPLLAAKSPPAKRPPCKCATSHPARWAGQARDSRQ